MAEETGERFIARQGLFLLLLALKMKEAMRANPGSLQKLRVTMTSSQQGNEDFSPTIIQLVNAVNTCMSKETDFPGALRKNASLWTA